jgi:hypothetical protein
MATRSSARWPTTFGSQSSARANSPTPTTGNKELAGKLLGPLTAQLEGGRALTLDNLIADGDFVAMQARDKSTTKTGKTYNNTYCQVYRIANGKV